MNRAYLSIAAVDVEKKSPSELFGELARKLPFALEPRQKAAWEYQIQHLRQLAKDLPQAFFFMEFLIPRMGRRADLIVLNGGVVFVVEYKLGAEQFDRTSINQVYGYGLDLKNFHEASHDLPIVPILVATEASGQENLSLQWDSDGLARPLCKNPAGLAKAILSSGKARQHPPIDATKWESGRYRPTPTIVEAAQALYRGHDVVEISRSEAGAENLTRTTDYVTKTIEKAKRENLKIICFVTGVPGSGKTLAGLNLATARQRAHADEHAVFLSGNGPLVEVLREALSLDAVAKARAEGRATSKTLEDRRTHAFVQNIHHFRDEALTSGAPPIEKVAVFDEAQRAWNVEQTSKFMRRKKGQAGFSMSEPEFLLGVMDRHKDWCAIICLVGEGQEINTGEAGIEEWLRALETVYPHWQAHVSPAQKFESKIVDVVTAPDLHLATSVRSFRAEQLSDFVGRVIDGNADGARHLASKLANYPIYVTRDLGAARKWLRGKARGPERIGLLASSNAMRLKPHGVFVKARIEPTNWFLAPPNDVRSSMALEDTATEFDVQGLELDWACLCWDANYRRAQGGWQAMQFVGTRWQTVKNNDRKKYVANSYRVLLTRARQGLVVYVPKGSNYDDSRPSEVYDGIYEFLKTCGLRDLDI